MIDNVIVYFKSELITKGHETIIKALSIMPLDSIEVYFDCRKSNFETIAHAFDSINVPYKPMLEIKLSNDITDITKKLEADKHIYVVTDDKALKSYCKVNNIRLLDFGVSITQSYLNGVYLDIVDRWQELSISMQKELSIKVILIDADDEDAEFLDDYFKYDFTRGVYQDVSKLNPKLDNQSLWSIQSSLLSAYTGEFLTILETSSKCHPIFVYENAIYLDYSKDESIKEKYSNADDLLYHEVNEYSDIAGIVEGVIEKLKDRYKREYQKV